MLHEPLQLVERGSLVVIINTATLDELKPCPGKLNNYHQGFIERTCCPVEDEVEPPCFSLVEMAKKIINSHPVLTGPPEYLPTSNF
jgi:hypothetical protein